jgi:cysteine synthase A
MLPVTNMESINAMRALSEQLGRRVGPSTGTNFHAMQLLAEAMLARGEQGSIMSLICDAGERYLNTYFDEAWVNKNFGDCAR